MVTYHSDQGINGNETKRIRKERAKQRCLQGIVNAALLAENCDECALAKEIRKQGAMIAKRWGFVDVPGLPETFLKTKGKEQ